MIVLRVELWPHGRETFAKEIGRAYIANDGTAHGDRGNYNVAVCRKDSVAVPREIYPPEVLKNPKYKDQPKARRAGHVVDYPRKAYPIWRLIAQAMLAAFPEEAKPPARKNKHAPAFTSLTAAGFELLAKPLRIAMKMTDKAVPEGEAGDALRAALEWLDAKFEPPAESPPEQ